MVFKPANYLQSFAISDSYYQFVVAPQNNLAAINYPEQIYEKVEAHRTILMSVAIIGLVLLFVLLSYRKMIGLELIIMVQLIY